MGPSWRRQDNPGPDHRQQTGDPLLHAFRCDEWRQRRTRSHREGASEPLFHDGFAHSFHRRDPPFLQIAAGLATWSCRERYRDAHRSDDRESLLRSDPPAIVPLPALCAQAVGARRPGGAPPSCRDRGRRTTETNHRAAGD